MTLILVARLAGLSCSIASFIGALADRCTGHGLQPLLTYALEWE